MGIWEQIHNPCFNYGEFAIIRSNAGLNGQRKQMLLEYLQKQEDMVVLMRIKTLHLNLVCG